MRIFGGPSHRYGVHQGLAHPDRRNLQSYTAWRIPHRRRLFKSPGWVQELLNHPDSSPVLFGVCSDEPGLGFIDRYMEWYVCLGSSKMGIWLWGERSFSCLRDTPGLGHPITGRNSGEVAVMDFGRPLRSIEMRIVHYGVIHM